MPLLIIIYTAFQRTLLFFKSFKQKTFLLTFFIVSLAVPKSYLLLISLINIYYNYFCFANQPYFTLYLENIISTYTSNLLLKLIYAFNKERGLNNKINNIFSVLKLSPFQIFRIIYYKSANIFLYIIFYNYICN